MDPTDLLGVVGAQLDRIGCPRFTTGSVASMVYGEPRFTNDIATIVAVQGPEALDWEYMALWAGRLGVEAEFERVRPRG